MRICIADTTVNSNLIGGAQTFLVKLLGGFVSAGHEVHLLADGEGSGWVRDALRSTGAKIHSDCRGGELVDDATPRVATWVNELNPEVYVVSVSPDIGWTVLPYLDPRIATLTIGHNDERTFYEPVEHYGRFLTRAVGVSDAICRKYREILSNESFKTEPQKTQKNTGEHGTDPNSFPILRSERVEWIPYGVETLERFDPLESRKADRPDGDAPLRLVYVGRFENTQKRIADIVAIARRLSSEGVAFEFDLVGDGEDMAFVRDQLADLIAAGSVRVHGWLPSEQVIQKLRYSEVFLLASAYEGFCISLIEAMANGCSPVVTDIESGNKQLVEDGVNGFIVPIGDVDAFVDRINLLSVNRGRLNEMRVKAWEIGRQYSVERMVESYVDCFERAIEDARANPRTLDPAFPLMESCRSKYPLWLRRLKAKAKRLATN